MSKNVQNWQLCSVMHNMSFVKKSNRLWMIFIISIANDQLQWVMCAWRYLHRSSICEQNWIIWIRSKFIWFLVIFDMTPSIDPPINRYTHPQVGVSQQIIHLWIELNYLNSVKIYLIFSDLTSPHECAAHAHMHMHTLHTHTH